MRFRKLRNRDRELDEEIRSHLQMAARDQIACGKSPRSAEQAARRQLGNVGLIKEVTRDMWGWTSLERFTQDVRYGLRVLRRSPGYASVAILSLALGIGANTAIFSLIDAVMLKSLPVRNPQELVTIGDPTRIGGLSEGSGGRTEFFSYPFFERLRARNTVFTDIFARSRTERLEVAPEDGSKAAGSDEATRCRFVSGNYFSVLGVPAALGRTFTEQETRVPGTAPVIVISDGYWKSQFGRDPNAIGRKLVVNGSKFTIIGVTPPVFTGEAVGAPADIWLPATMLLQASPGHDYLKNSQVYWLLLMGRLRPGVSLGQAAASVNVLGKQIFAELYKGNSPAEEYEQLIRQKIIVLPGAKGFSRIRHDFSLPLMMLMGTVGLVLLICCANVANLQLARAAGRRRETSLRLAIGAGRVRLVRQLATESLLLAVAGAALALCFAVWASHLLLRLTSANDQLPVDIHLDGAMLAFTVGVAVLAALLFGLVPAWQSTRIDLVSGLKESKSGTGHGSGQSLGRALI
ncbi:MAG: ABC transporter permease, partial [Acidobacteriaceae bacterium]|nr:ABC transporter permease [Acidobacteriaceae bacterium]